MELFYARLALVNRLAAAETPALGPELARALEEAKAANAGPVPPAARRRRLEDVAGAEWKSASSLRRHAYKHVEVASTLEDYQVAVARVLTGPERMMLRMDETGAL